MYLCSTIFFVFMVGKHKWTDKDTNKDTKPHTMVGDDDAKYFALALGFR